MSTSYYMKNKQNKKLNNILKQIPYINVREAAFNEYYKTTKIGQTSYGWVFVVDNFECLQELYDRLQDKEIVDEYDREITVDDLFKIILSISDRETQGYPYFELREQVFAGDTYRYDVFKGG